MKSQDAKLFTPGGIQGVMSEEELQAAINRSGILKERAKEEYFIFVRGSMDPETGNLQGSKSYFKLQEVLDEYYKMPRKERRKYGIWDVYRNFPLDIVAAKENGLRAPDCKIDPDSGEVLGYRI